MSGGGTGSSGPMANIVVRNVFDQGRVYLVECIEKDHLLDGQTFCDELMILPPGVYEVIVQSLNPSCRMEQSHYKVVVKPSQTVELQVNLVCGGNNGGLDVIVRERRVPTVIDIDFEFVGGGRANKYMCQYGDDVEVAVAFSKPDPTAECVAFDFDWYVKKPGDTKFSGSITPPIVPGSAVVEEGPGDSCLFRVTLDADSAEGSYELKVVVVFDGASASFSFPIHLIDCGLCSDDLSYSGTNDFSISFRFKLPGTYSGTFALLNQRAVCNRGMFWDLRLAGGMLYFETDDGVGYAGLFSSGHAPLNDGLAHNILIERTSGTIRIYVDGVLRGTVAAPVSSFGALAPLAVGNSVCVGVDGTQPFPVTPGAKLVDVCVTDP